MHIYDIYTYPSFWGVFRGGQAFFYSFWVKLYVYIPVRPYVLTFLLYPFILFFSVWRIRDVYPRSRILIFTHPGSRISDPGSKNSNKREGWKKKIFHTFLCSHKTHKIENYFSFEVLKKKIWANFQRIIEFFTQKIVTKLSKIWLWGPGSEIRDLEKTYFGSRIQGSKRHRTRIPDPDPQHWFFSFLLGILFVFFSSL